MSQSQKHTPVIYLDGSMGQAVSTGNNAAWKCRCGQDNILIGRSGMLRGPSQKLKVACPSIDCELVYFVVPQSKNMGPVKEVVEIKS